MGYAYGSKLHIFVNKFHNFSINGKVIWFGKCIIPKKDSKFFMDSPRRRRDAETVAATQRSPTIANGGQETDTPYPDGSRGLSPRSPSSLPSPPMGAKGAPYLFEDEHEEEDDSP